MYDKHRPWPSFFHKVVEIDHSNHRLDYDVSIERWLYCAGHSGTWLQVLTLPLGHWDFSGIFLGMKMVDVLASKCGSSTIMPFRIWAKSKTLLIGLSQRLALPHRKQKKAFSASRLPSRAGWSSCNQHNGYYRKSAVQQYRINPHHQIAPNRLELHY